MLEELQRRNYSTVTTRNYLRVVAEFAKFFGKSPDKLGLNELRTYQAYLLRVRKLTPGTDQPGSGTALFFVKTLKRHRFRDFLPYPQDQRRLPTVLSREEVSRLINKAGTLFRRTLLMTLYGTGMRRSELAHLKVGDMDSQRMIIRVVAGKRGKDRDLPFASPLRIAAHRHLRPLHPQKTQSCVPLFADMSQPAMFPAGVFLRNESQITRHLAPTTESFHRPYDEHES
jgi:site-specific recombinase XerD